MVPDTRTRMVEAAIVALQRHGVAGMSFTDVLAGSGAARGAIYHHFPGGKAQLVAEAAQRNGADVQAHLAALPAGSPREVVEAFLAAVRPVLAASTTGAGCAVAAVTVGAAAGSDTDDERLRRMAATTFSSWSQALSNRLTAAGLPPGEAADLAVTLITLLEGAHVLCRAAGTLEPFDHTVRAAVNLVPGHGGTAASPSRPAIP
ncbi:MAG: TetR/AcrR family transcriptional regulator [Actinomycetota bacterium]|nr:TetR/AcrR family transcriptional regulator [Actinomycetota bacterium]